MARARVGQGSSESLQVVVSAETRQRIDLMVKRFGWSSRSELLRELLLALADGNVRVMRGTSKQLSATVKEGGCKTRTMGKE